GLTLWDIESGRAILRVASADCAVLSVAFSPDGKYLVRVDREKVSLFDAATGRERRHWHLAGLEAVASLPGTPRFVVAARGAAYAHVFDAERTAGLPHWQVEAPVVAPSPSGRSFVGDSDARLYLVDARTGRVRCRFSVTTDPETFGGAAYPSEQQSALSQDDQRLYLVRPTGALLTFDATTGRKFGELDPPPGWKESGYRARVALSPDGAVAYVSKRGAPTHRRDLKTGKWLDPLPVMPGGPLVPHPDGKRLFLIATDGVLRRYDLTTLKEIRPPGFTTEVSAVASLSGKRVAVASAGATGRFAMFDVTGKELWSVPLRGRRGAPRWSDDEQLVACACKREVVVFDAGTGRVIQRLRTPDPGRRFTGVIGFGAAADRLVAA